MKPAARCHLCHREIASYMPRVRAALQAEATVKTGKGSSKLIGSFHPACWEIVQQAIDKAAALVAT